MKKKGYYQIRAERAKQKIIDLLNVVNEDFAKEAELSLGKNFNTANGWLLSGKRQGLISAKMILSENNILVKGGY